MARKLVEIEAEVATLGQGIHNPNRAQAAPKGDLASRRLLDAKLNFGVGNYDDAALALYDFVEKNPSHGSWDEGLYYLAESLFQKGDFVASRTFFTKIAVDRGSSSKFYQQALERLIELTLKLDDSEGVQRWLSSLDAVPRDKLRASVPYVRGKYSYFKERYDEALASFATVPADSSYALQAMYFSGASHVAKGDLAKAEETYRELVRRTGNTDQEAKVLELAHMALGRLYYEQDQPSKAVNAYLSIPRKSELFDEAVFEVSWVYVKNKEFNKALRALELLALSDPKSQKMPDVRILEGNLRIRKAQGIADDGKGNSKEEYDRAVAVFEDTRRSFGESHKQLQELLTSQGDASAFLAQITGRHSDAFDVSATLPDVAVAWLRKEPEVERVVHIETDLGQIAGEIADAEATIERLEAAMNSPSKVNIFPELAEKQIRSTEILELILTLETKLASEARKHLNDVLTAEERSRLGTMESNRTSLTRALHGASLDGEVTESERVRQARERFVTLQKRAAEASTVIDVAEAQLVALEKYVADQGLQPAEREAVLKEMSALRKDVDSMRAELESVRQEAVLAQDRAGTADAAAAKRVLLRKQLRDSLAEEQRFLQQLAGKASAENRDKLGQIALLNQKTHSITMKLDVVNTNINGVVEVALADVRSSLAEEKANLVAYKQEFSNFEQESRSLGGHVLSDTFQSVSEAFHDILVRADVGIVDVAWSLKEATQTTLKRLNLDQARERRNLDSNFADVLKDMRRARVKELFKQAEGSN